MGEFSLFWATGTTGDGTSTYTDSQLFAWLRRTFNSDMYADRGPLKGYNNELAVTADSGKVIVGTGAAYVYGIPYELDAALAVTIPTPVANTRVDRIVLRADWTAKTVRVTRIAGTEGAGAPNITQNLGSVYDVKLAQVSVTTGGVITVTDERQFCRFATEVTTENIADGAITAAKISGGAVGASQLADGAVTTAKISGGAVGASQLANGAVTTAKIANDAVDDTKAGPRVPYVNPRQGGSATDWNMVGTISYTVGAVRIQCGNAQCDSGRFNVTFPVAFSAKPLIFLTVDSGIQRTASIGLGRASATGFSGAVTFHGVGAAQGYEHQQGDELDTVSWIAIGPE